MLCRKSLPISIFGSSSTHFHRGTKKHSNLFYQVLVPLQEKKNQSLFCKPGSLTPSIKSLLQFRLRFSFFRARSLEVGSFFSPRGLLCVSPVNVLHHVIPWLLLTQQREKATKARKETENYIFCFFLFLSFLSLKKPWLNWEKEELQRYLPLLIWKLSMKIVSDGQRLWLSGRAHAIWSKGHGLKSLKVLGFVSLPFLSLSLLRCVLNQAPRGGTYLCNLGQTKPNVHRMSQKRLR